MLRSCVAALALTLVSIPAAQADPRPVAPSPQVTGQPTGQAAEAVPENPFHVFAVRGAPASLAPGEVLHVQGSMTNDAITAQRPVIAVYLTSTDGSQLRVGSRRVHAVGAAQGRGFALALRLPGAVPDGEYGLQTCLRVTAAQTARCATSTRTITVDGTPPPGPGYGDGARSAGDPLFPTIGNGGYDALHYDLDLSYDPATRVLLGTTVMRAEATQGLRSFSLDLQGLQVSDVKVDGSAALYSRRGTKLIVRPAIGVRRGADLRVAVTYGGVVTPVIDPDGSQEGFIPTDTGAVVVCEPIGAQGWFPSNNVPDDKARFDVEMTVPRGKEVIGNGVLTGHTVQGSTETFHWTERRPMATYLSTATVGDYQITEATSPAGVPLYTAVDTAANGGSPAASPAQLAANRRSLLAGGAVVDYFAEQYGAYPFESSGGIIANAPDIGYQLEVQGRPIYTSNDAAALEHELAHQWFGDEVTLSDWSDIWLAEGFAVWSEWLYAADHGGPSTAESGASAYQIPVTSSPYGVWRPLIVTDARYLFGGAPYVRGATMLEALRQQIGDRNFRSLLRIYLRRHAFGNATTAQFVAMAQARTAVDLGPFFADWLYTDGKPTVSPPTAG